MNKLTKKIGALICCLALVVSGFGGIVIDKADAATKSYVKSVTVKLNGKTMKAGDEYDAYIGSSADNTPSVYLTTSAAIAGKTASKVVTAEVVKGAKYASLSKVSTNKYKVTFKAEGKTKIKITSKSKGKSGQNFCKYIYINTHKTSLGAEDSTVDVMVGEEGKIKLTMSDGFKSVKASAPSGIEVTKNSSKSWTVKSSKVGTYSIKFTGTTGGNKATRTKTVKVKVLSKKTTFAASAKTSHTAGYTLSDIRIKDADGKDATSSFFYTDLAGIAAANKVKSGSDLTLSIGSSNYKATYKNKEFTYTKNNAAVKMNASALADISVAKDTKITHKEIKKINTLLALLSTGADYKSAKYTITAKVNGVTVKAKDVQFVNGEIFFYGNDGKTKYKATFSNDGSLVVKWVSGAPQKFADSQLGEALTAMWK